ncbi:MAG: PD40 domain-containing protein [Phycisphaerales bacterium]|nr:PD40 domain-containing protein [Phycisphaerales bacterium]
MRLSFILAFITTVLSIGGPALAAAVDLPRAPSISPDGSQIVFSWRGDLWKAPSRGGEAVRLTAHPANELLSAWSPDGRLIAFSSTRDGGSNLFVMNADGSGTRQVTRTDQRLALSGWSPDSKRILFSASIEGDVYRDVRPYSVSVDGGPATRLHDAFGHEPRISPDGATLLFGRGGSAWFRRGYRGPDNRDVWTFTLANKAFQRHTTWTGNDGKARWAGDSQKIIFTSDREGGVVNLYSMTLADREQAEGKSRRLTDFRDADVVDFDVSADGKTAVVLVWDTLYTLALPDGKPTPITLTAADDETDNFTLRSIGRDVSEAALSPDGKTLAVVAYGDVYVRAVEEGSPTRRVTRSPARERDIAWSPDGMRLYFTSDEPGRDQIYAASVALTRKDVRESFEKTTKPKPAEPSPAPPPPSAEPAKPEEPKPAAEPKPEPQSQPKGPESAVDAAADQVRRRPPGAAGAGGAGAGAAAGGEPAGDSEKKDAPPAGNKDTDRWTDAIRFTVEHVVESAFNDRAPVPSPDGKALAFRRTRGDIVILDLASKAERGLLKSWDLSIGLRWSPDSRHLAYAVEDKDYNSDIWVARADGSSPPVNITRHPDSDIEPRWSSDGKVLTFLSDRVGRQFEVWGVFLDKDLEALAGRDLEKYFTEAAKAAKRLKPPPVRKPAAPKPAEPAKPEAEAPKPDTAPAADAKSDTPKADQPKDKDEAAKPSKPVELSLDDAYLRLRRITTAGGSKSNLEMTPGGDRVIYTANDGGEALWSVKWDGTDKKRLHETASVQMISLTGDKIVFVREGGAGTVGPEGGKVESLPVEDRVRIDLQAQASQKFLEAARIMDLQFYHPTMKGLDWALVSRRYHELARKSRTADEFDYVANRMLGELNASHMGVTSPDEPQPNIQPNGRLGIDSRRTEQGFEVIRVIDRGPASRGEMQLRAGDVITAVDDQPFGPGDTVESRLRGRAGQEVILTIIRKLDAAPEPVELRVLTTPISGAAETDLRYRAWARANAALVNDWSKGRLGYLHIRGMDEASLVDFERDLFAAAAGKDGLLIDVRNNGGGSTADLVLASIMVRPHAYTLSRGADPAVTDGYPRDRLFIQRYTRPVNMLCNEKSFSNAEIVSHAFKTLKRGNLVGQQTYGGVISTGAARLIDGTTIRTPGRGWFLPDGTDLENNGALPDITVPQTPEDESAAFDRQLKAAADDLIKRIDAGGAAGVAGAPPRYVNDAPAAAQPAAPAATAPR